MSQGTDSLIRSMFRTGVMVVVALILILGILPAALAAQAASLH